MSGTMAVKRLIQVSKLDLSFSIKSYGNCDITFVIAAQLRNSHPILDLNLSISLETSFK